MPNPSTFEQASLVLNDITKQATGRSALATTTQNFISIATTALSVNKDKVYNALIGMCGRTIFNIRPWSATMTGLEKDLPTWGEFMRKLNIVASDWKDNEAYKYPVTYDATQNPPTGNGLSVDPWKINKREFVETYFTGQAVFADQYTIFEDQLETAFHGPEELMQFISMHTVDENNKVEMVKDNVSRTLVTNFVGGILAENDSSRVVKLVTLYNSELGLSGASAYTPTSIMQPDNYPAFMQWAYGKIAEIASMLKENSVKYQTTISGKPIYRATPYQNQHFYELAKYRYAMESRVLATTFHDNYLKLGGDVETVNFWQSIDSPDSINVKPTYTNTSGIVTTTESAIEQANVFGVLFDDMAMGWSMIKHHTHLTPTNPSGEYRNVFHNMRIRCASDNTEKGVVFLLA